MKGLTLRTVALLAMIAGVSACKAKSTFVHVTVQPAANGEPAVAITEIELQLDMAGKTDKVILKEAGNAPITLPTDVTLEVKSGSGQLAIIAIAKDATGAEVDRGTTTAQVSTGAIAESSVVLAGGKPDLVPTEATHEFGAHLSGVVGSPVNLTFHNRGFRPSGAISAAIGGVGAGSWAITTNTCNGLALAPGSDCAITLTFKPLTVGALAATLTITATPGGSATIALTGTGSSNPQTLTVAVSGAGSGTVTSNPAGMSCASGSCNHDYDWGTQVSLTATPANGSHFTGWTGACSGTGACSVTTSAATSVGASFALDSETLTVTVVGDGTVQSQDGFITCTSAGESTCSHSYDFGSVVSFTQSANAGAHFGSWSDPICGASAECAITLSGNTNLTATFPPNTHTVTVTLSGTGGGVLASEEAPNKKLDCTWDGPNGLQTGTCTANYDNGQQFTVDATPDGVSYVSNGGLTGTTSTCSGTPCTIDVGDNDITISITFTHNAVPVTVSFAGSGTGTVKDDSGATCTNSSSPPCQLFEVYGASPTVDAIADATAVFTSWTGLPCEGGGPSCELTNITTDTALTVDFTAVIPVTVAGGGNGSGTIVSDVGGINCTITNGVASGTCTGGVLSGTDITLSATLSTGTTSLSWSASGCVVSGNSCKFTNLTSAPPTTTATLTLQQFTVAVTGQGSVTGAGSGTITGGSLNCTITSGVASGTCSTSVNYGSGLTLTATASNGANGFFGWSGSSCTVSGNTCAFTNVTAAPATTTATFKTTFAVAVTGPGAITGVGSGSVSATVTSGVVIGTALACTITGGTASGTCTTTVTHGSQVVLNATPSGGANGFFGWSGSACTASGTQCTFSSVTATPAATTATFKTTFNVTVIGPGAITGVGSGSVSATVTNGAAVGTALACTITGGTASGTCTTAVTHGSQVVLNATPAGGANGFFGWSGSACTVSGTQCTFSSVTATPAVTTATFKTTFNVAVIGSGAITGVGSGSVAATVTNGAVVGTALACTITSGTASGTCTTTVTHGSQVVLNATAAGGANGFFSWSGSSCTASGTQCTFSSVTATPAITTATFKTTFVITVAGQGSGAGAGNGTITASVTSGVVIGNALSCTVTAGVSSGTCTTTVTHGSAVTLTAAAGSGANGFSAWSGGGCTPSGNTCSYASVTATPASTAVATFLVTFAVAVQGQGAVAGAGNGSVSGGGLNCTITSGVASGACSVAVNYGSTLVLSESFSGANNFVNWSGGCSGTSSTCSISNITSTPAATTATFVQTFVLTVATAGNAGGNISGPNGLNCGNGGSACSVSYNYGTVVTPVVNPVVNAVFSGWTGACTAFFGSCAITMTSAQSVTGFFNPSTNFCSTGTTPQVFDSTMHGCFPSTLSTYANRQNSCAPNCRVAQPDEWAAHRNGITPSRDYWTSDALRYSIAQGVCGTGSCGPSKCYVSTAPATTSNSCGSAPFLVCGTTTNCSFTHCGLDSIAPDQFFGGCENSAGGVAGTLCVCGAPLWHVDPSGSDSNPGTFTQPFLTIAKGLGAASSGQQVTVHPGTYNESFTVPGGVILIGDESTVGSTTTINGNLTMAAGSTLAGFTVGKAGGTGINMNAANVTVRNNTITGNVNGMQIGGSTNALIALNTIVGNSGEGIYNSGASSGRLENNSITGHTYNIEYDGAGPDLGGGGAPASVGNNIISCAANADLWVTGGQTITAANNKWDHGPPTNNGSTYFGTGIDIFTNVAGNVTSVNTGARQTTSPCACATSATSVQTFDGAMNGCIASGGISWTNRATLCPLGTHACSSSEWNAHWGGTQPTSSYWTSDILNYVNGSNGTGHCAVTPGASSTTCGANASMLICPSGSSLCQVNTCDLSASVPATSTQAFGGCAIQPGGFPNALGTVCCNP